jgi:hypothetical protein
MTISDTLNKLLLSPLSAQSLPVGKHIAFSLVSIHALITMTARKRTVFIKAYTSRTGSANAISFPSCQNWSYVQNTHSVVNLSSLPYSS